MKITFEGTLQEYLALLGFGHLHGGGGVEAAKGVIEAAKGVEEKTQLPPSPGPPAVMPPPPPASMSDFEPLSGGHLRLVEDENYRQVLESRQAKLPELEPETRLSARKFFKNVVADWIQGFEQEGPQPNRLELMAKLRSSRWVVPILVMAHEHGSLQRLVENVLLELGPEHIPTGPWRPSSVGVGTEWHDWVDRITSNMIQIASVSAFPDLVSVHDVSGTIWRRKAVSTQWGG